MIGQTISHYKILEKLGEGGMGVVYKAQDLKLDRLVALKFLPASVVASEEEIARFQQEAKAISALNHPNIATIHDVDEADGQRFLVLEYLPGGTLKSRVKSLQSSGKELSVKEIVELGLQIGEGLSHAHRHGIVHRDVKTDNVMLTEEGRVKITDFGLAKLRGGAHLTKTGTTVGTAAYMSPEQVMGESVDHRSDLFSYGVVLYELATGHLPFRGEHEAALSYSIVNESPVPMKSLRADLPDGLERIVTRLLEKEQEKRYQSAQDVVLDLRNLQQEISGVIAAPIKRSKLPWIVASAAVVLPAVALMLFYPRKTVSVDRKSIAVLPFKNLSEDKENEYFSDGITEDIITQISKISELKVISRTSVMRYKNADKSLRDIGKELDVATILEGSVRRANNEVRIVAQLIDANTDEHLWAQTYDKELTKIFDIQSEIAQQIAAALKAKLAPAEKERIEKKPTENLDAYAYYLKGRDYYYSYRKQDNENAIELFKRALQLDPNYALAYAGLGDAYAQRMWRFGFPARWLDSAIVVSGKAISLDPNLAEAYKAIGLAYEYKGWLRKALDADRKAVELNPNYHPAVANIGWVNWFLGEYSEALQWMRKGQALAPTNAQTSFGVAHIYLSLGDDANAMKWYQKALELQPDLVNALEGMGRLFLWKGQYDEAFGYGQRILSLDSKDLTGLILAGDAQIFSGNLVKAREYYEQALSIDSTRWNFYTNLGYLLWKSGQTVRAQKMFNEGLKRALKEIEKGNEWWDPPFHIAAVNAITGRKAEALEWLQRAIDAGWRFSSLGLKDPLLENLRNDDQFKQMMDQVKSKVDEMRKKVEAQEANHQP
jgi:serine/threonine protein kinase/Flp pilus assembly protein TadD